MPSSSTPGDRIRTLFQDAGDAVIVAPFMKVAPLSSLLQAVPSRARLRCVTRWLPREVAAGVSDPEVFGILRERGNATLSLVDRLHAKLYIGDGKCLAGSANVTFAGFGESGSSGNIEVLLETTTANPDISRTLEDIDREAVEATEAMAVSVRRLADNLETTPDGVAEPSQAIVWHPLSRRPEDAFRMYSSPPDGYLTTADRRLITDVAGCNLRPGLDEAAFQRAVRELLAAIPMSNAILGATEDFLFTRREADEFLEPMTSDDYSATDIWTAFVRWMAYYFSAELTIQEVSELALRRAQDIVL